MVKGPAHFINSYCQKKGIRFSFGCGQDNIVNVIDRAWRQKNRQRLDYAKQQFLSRCRQFKVGSRAYTQPPPAMMNDLYNWAIREANASRAAEESRAKQTKSAGNGRR